MLRHYSVSLAALAGMTLSVASWAQPNPSADDLIKSLTPSAQSLKSSGTRGLHRLEPVDDAPATHSARPVSPAAGAVTAVRQTVEPSQMGTSDAAAPSASLFVNFPSGSADLTPQAMATLDELGKALSSNALSSYHFRIEGHTDTVGSKDYNRDLSARRAASVVAYIKQKFGIDSSRMVAVGLGSDHLLVPTRDQTPEARNRRVQIVNVGA